MTKMKSIRCDDTLGSQAAAVAAEYGLDLSTATRAFWKEMVRTQSIPLDFGRGIRYRNIWNDARQLDHDENGYPHCRRTGRNFLMIEFSPADSMPYT